MKRSFLLLLGLFILAVLSGCAYFQKKDEPPPLPPIEEVKPPLSLKGDHFNSFPWTALQSPKKDGNDPDTITVTVKDGDTLESISESMMGSAGMAPGLAAFNKLSSSASLSSGDKVVIPNPIIGVSSKITVKSKGSKEFGDPQNLGVSFSKGDEYKLRFESNVNGFLYVFRKSAKGVNILFPAALKKSKRNQHPEPLMRDSGKVIAHDPVSIPLGKNGFVYDPKNAGDMLYVFLSMRKVNELEELKSKSPIRVEDLEDVMRRVKEGEIRNEPPIHVLRITDPGEILGFTLNIDG